ncbi:MAG: DUF1684 domain-containing protein [Anaerolineaceae bacterium]|nr:DUF1684 domain-containing protein [Anaerolineaceae bacterium]
MLDLLDYRRRVTALYTAVRASTNPATACEDFRQQRDDLFHSHSQSALSPGQKAQFTGLRYYPYDSAYRVVAQIDRDVEPEILQVDLGDDGQFAYQRFGQVTFTLPTGSGCLSLFWIKGYGGGLFLPFGDATNKDTTYGAGRYLYDTIKGADLGTDKDRLVLDFNFAYNPSCSYHYRWVCPLAPPENRLLFAVPAGEMLLNLPPD